MSKANPQGLRQIIDAHQHFWRYSAADYGWIGETMPRLRRDFLPADLKPLLDQSGVSATIAVQARQCVAETEWLLKLAATHAWIAGVLGWAPLAEPGVEDQIARWRAAPGGNALRGLRHVAQDEPDPEFLLRPDFNRGVAAVTRAGLAYDILIFERQLPAAIAFVDRHPNQVFVLDHIAKPRVAAGELEPWRTRLRALAERPNVYGKFSGVVTEADWTSWREDDLSRYWDAALEAFGPRRLMFGSDWPVLLLAADYAAWLGFVRRQIAALGADERSAIMGDTARRAYRLAWRE